jgi:hypothetical protein
MHSFVRRTHACSLRALALVLLAGCAAAAADAHPAPQLSPAARFAPADHYAGVLERGRSWEYRVETTFTAQDGATDPSSHTQVGHAACRVVHAERSARRSLSRITCDRALSELQIHAAVPVGASFLEGFWMADARGLWKSAEFGDDARMMVISSSPAEGKKQQEGADGIGGEATIVERRGKAWCVTHVSWGGDSAGDTFCFTQDGIVAGMRQFAGGEFKEVRFCVDELLCRQLPK